MKLSILSYLLLKGEIKCLFVKKGEKKNDPSTLPYSHISNYFFSSPQHFVMLPELIYRLKSLRFSSVKEL